MNTAASRAPVLQRWFVGVVATAIVLVILVQGRFLLVPLAIAVLVFSLMSAAIDRIGRWHVGRWRVAQWLATLITVALVSAAILGILTILYGQVDALVADGPEFVARAEGLVAALFVWLGDDVSAGIMAAFEDIDLAAYLRSLAGSAGYVLATTVLIVLYIGFLFSERRRLPHKLARLFDDQQRARRFGAVYRSITRSVHRYVLIKSIISLTTGLTVYVVMRLFGLNFAEAWAMLSVFLNFIPNIGSIVATLLPTMAALAQFDTWAAVLALFLALGTIQFVVGNVLEPWLFGRSLHLSPFVIILSLTFWGALWGIVGMFLAVPIMVMVMIVCSHVPALHPVAVMLSRDGNPVPREDGERRRWRTKESGARAGQRGRSGV